MRYVHQFCFTWQACTPEHTCTVQTASTSFLHVYPKSVTMLRPTLPSKTIQQLLHVNYSPVLVLFAGSITSYQHVQLDVPFRTHDWKHFFFLLCCTCRCWEDRHRPGGCWPDRCPDRLQGINTLTWYTPTASTAATTILSRWSAVRNLCAVIAMCIGWTPRPGWYQISTKAHKRRRMHTERNRI